MLPPCCSPPVHPVTSPSSGGSWSPLPPAWWSAGSGTCATVARRAHVRAHGHRRGRVHGVRGGVPGRGGPVIAGVATGIGFIGAGLVWRGHANDVHGLTTAAAIWAMVAVGVLAGVGHLRFAVGVTALILLLLESPFAPIIRFVDPKRLAGRFRTEPARPTKTARAGTSLHPPTSQET